MFGVLVSNAENWIRSVRSGESCAPIWLVSPQRPIRALTARKRLSREVEAWAEQARLNAASSIEHGEQIDWPFLHQSHSGNSQFHDGPLTSDAHPNDGQGQRFKIQRRSALSGILVNILAAP
ncbi:hypothetical protein [Bradyrhizobium elkanii]|uniref:hypothetical protein n=1 Tax=Bradyrhizobium elkanii TaxID=29448 RepID=UPI002169317A|nr:hypothetical protein [Bradyrhizobium elkanii]MCS3474141.1 hypothetical protein [Bradyrhizobium elkanii]